MSFTLNLTFELPSNCSLEGNNKFIYDGLIFHFEKTQFKGEKGIRHKLVVIGFSSEEQAKYYFERIWMGLYWVALKQQIPIFGKIQLEEIFCNTNDLHQEDGYCNISSSVIFPSDKKIIALGGWVECWDHYKLDIISKNLTQGMNRFDKLAKRIFNKNDQEARRLRFAMELFISHFYETSIEIKFYNLVTILDVLSSSESEASKEPLLTNLIDSFSNYVDEYINMIESEDYSLEIKAKNKKLLKDLKSQILNWKKIPKKEQIIQFLDRLKNSSVIKEFSNIDISSLTTKDIKKMYDMRNKIAHGTVISDDNLIKIFNCAKINIPKIIELSFILFEHKS